MVAKRAKKNSKYFIIWDNEAIKFMASFNIPSRFPNEILV